MDMPPSPEPRPGGGAPPPLPVGPPPLPAPAVRRKRLSTGRQVARVLVWVTFLVVLGARLVWQPERWDRPRFDRARGDEAAFGQFDGGRRGRRGPTPTLEPATPVPADLRRLEIEVTPGDVEQLRAYHWNGWNRGGPTTERPQVRVVVREGGIVHSNVALQPKGSAGSFRPFDDKPALTLNFHKFEKGREFHGLRKLSLNNSVQDPSFIHEILCRELYTAAGVPAPVADHVTVLLNGRDLGLYVLTEGWGKPFVRRHFPDDGGNLYDGGFVQDIDGELTVASGDDEEDHAALQRLIRAVADPEPAGRWERLGRVLDVDRFLTLLALDVLTCNWDGYCLNRNNYRVFHDRSTDRMVFLPHGMDQMFGTGRRMDPESDILPSPRGAVAHAVLATAEGRRGYLDRLKQLRTTVFREEILTNRVVQVAARIRPTLAAYHPSWATHHDFEVADLIDRIGRRIRSVDEQLANPPEPAAFGPDGTLPLGRWESRGGGQGGRATAGRGEADGIPVLILRTADGPGSGSWRTRLILDPGRYRFEGRVRLQATSGTAAAGLRVSGYRFQQVLEPGPDWQTAGFRLAVEQPWSDVELVAEFGGDDGRAEFDERSLRLVREE